MSLTSLSQPYACIEALLHHIGEPVIGAPCTARFERDNLDWQSRELATVSMLAAMSGVEPQLKSHIGISMNIGLRREQLSRLADVLEAQVSLEAAERVRAAAHP